MCMTVNNMSFPILNVMFTVLEIIHIQYLRTNVWLLEILFSLFSRKIEMFFTLHTI